MAPGASVLLDDGDMAAATEYVLMVVEFFCGAVYVRGCAAELLKMADRSITLWRELAGLEAVSADASAVDV